jgi:uncharacterized membrane protein YgdD (TMEM256/DUF423 family)
MQAPVNDASVRAALSAGALLCGSAVLLGAFGAHALEARLAESGQADTWDTAVRYQLAHGLALLVLAAGAGQPRWPLGPALQRWLARGLVLGALLFSGSLYGLALGGPGWLGPLTPLGGLAWLAAWTALCVAALRQRAP